MMQMAHHRYNLLFRWMHEMLTIHHFALLLFQNYLSIQVGMLQRIHHQYNRYESTLDDTLIGIESLSSGYLTHHIMDPKTLSRYLEAIADNMEDTAPDYKPVFTDVYQYYGNSLTSFTNTIDDLLLLILIKLKVQVPIFTLQHGDSTSTLRCRNLPRWKMRVHSNSAIKLNTLH